MTDIVERLREVASIETGLLYSRRTMLEEAAEEIDRLRAENARIRGALTDIKAEAFQREAIPGAKSSKDEIRGASMALSARLSSVERLCRSALKAKEARK